jgi:hypothetical protein
MQDTVDHADGSVPRTLADTIEDAPVRVWPLLRRHDLTIARDGAAKAQELAGPTLARVQTAIGLLSL